MTPRNIATVFGPTLMPNPYPPADGLHLDPNMNASYIIIELLCTQVDRFADSALNNYIVPLCNHLYKCKLYTALHHTGGPPL